jgi:hypothetical protein
MFLFGSEGIYWSRLALVVRCAESVGLGTTEI